MQISKLAGAALPWYARLAAVLLAGACFFLLGVVWGERTAGEREIARADERVKEAAEQATKLAQAQAKVVIKTEIRYRDRVRTIYQKGETIEKEVPVFVTETDNDRFGVNVGFVRTYNAAWANAPAGSPAESDRGPAGIPLSDVAAADAHNAAACHAWREQALTLRQLYRDVQATLGTQERAQ